MLDRTSFLFEMRLHMAYAPRWKTVTHAEWHASLESHYAKQLRDLSRPPYHEASGFTRDRWMLRDRDHRPWRRSISGGEKPYAWTRIYWRTFGRLLKHAALAGFYGSMGDGGGEHHRYDTNRRNHAILTGLTA